MSHNILYYNSDEFKKELKQEKGYVVLDFFSEDCPPCSQLAPIFERMAEKFPHVKFIKMLRQENRSLAESLGVKGSPTVLFFKDGQEVGERLKGYIILSQMRLAMEELLEIKAEQKEKKQFEADVIVLGGGPAGLTSALYTSRAKLRTIVIDQGLPGGQAASTFHIANYPGTPGTVSGKELMDNMLKQAMDFGAEIHDLQEVNSIDLTGEQKRVITEEAQYSAPVVILATGAESRRLPVEEEPNFRGMGVHYCATCDGAMFQDAEQLAVIGGGDSAVEEALYLTRFAKHVTIIYRGDQLKASKTAREEAAENHKISILWNSEVRSLVGGKHLKGLLVENVKTHETTTLDVNGVFVYIGMEPRTSMLRDQIKVDPSGYIDSDEEMGTNIEGVFVAGDVRQKTVRQVAKAVGDGVVAAVNAERYLNKRLKEKSI